MKNSVRATRVGGILLLGLLVFSAGGCQLDYLFSGRGVSQRVYHIKAKQRVLVLVDSSPESPLSIHAVSSLIVATNQDLYKNRAATILIPPYRLVALMKSHPVSYREMGIADIARALNANLVIYIFIDRFRNQLISDKQITQGDAQAYIKLVSASGTRLWPKGATPGQLVTARVPPGLAMSQNTVSVQDSLLAQIANTTAGFFYAHSKTYKQSESGN